jgi:hypothetical protein
MSKELVCSRATQEYVMLNWHPVEFHPGCRFEKNVKTYVDEYCQAQYLPLGTFQVSKVYFHKLEDATHIQQLVDQTKPKHFVEIQLDVNDRPKRDKIFSWLLEHVGPELVWSWPDGKWNTGYSANKWGVWFNDEQAATQFAMCWS